MTDEVENLAVTPVPEQDATAAPETEVQSPNTSEAAPSYAKGAVYFDTTLNKMRVGGATGWETITSV